MNDNMTPDISKSPSVVLHDEALAAEARFEEAFKVLRLAQRAHGKAALALRLASDRCTTAEREASAAWERANEATTNLF
jgi:hypothetical protein